MIGARADGVSLRALFSRGLHLPHTPPLGTCLSRVGRAGLCLVNAIIIIVYIYFVSFMARVSVVSAEQVCARVYI